MVNKKETCFYKRIRPCIVKYITKHSENERVQFNSEIEFFYGTSGFRDKFETNVCDLLNAINKSGFLLGLLFIKYNYAIIEKYKLFDAEEKEKHKQFFHLYKNGVVSWKNVGIVVTASHNPSDENGVKLIDVDGKQIGQTIEHYLNKLVNSHLYFLKENKNCSISDIIDYIIDQIANYLKTEASLDLFDDLEYARIAQIDDIIYYYNLHNTIKANICIGFDTRESGVFCNHVLVEALQCLNIKKCINNMCYITTPCMHFVIYYLNHHKEDEKINKVLENINGYTYHKKEDDMDSLNGFCLQMIEQARQLYYSDTGREFSTTDFAQEKGATLSRCSKTSNIEGTLQSNIDLVAYQAEISKFDLHAYNSDQFCYDYFCLLFEDLFYFLNKNFHNRQLNGVEQEEVIYVDCANGIAGIKIDKVNSLFKLLKKKIQKINSLKDKTDDINEGCGANYVYWRNQLPANFSVEEITGKKCCSFDGDADRIVYFYVEENNDVPVESTTRNNSAEALGTQDNAIEKGYREVTANDSTHVKVLDGAKIIALLLKFIVNILSQINMEKANSLGDKEHIKKLDLSVIQTAYGNSACINYIKHVKEQAEKKYEIFKYIDINVKYTKTGVKYVERHVRHSSVGIYFEPNGHGTIYTNIKQVNEWAQKLHILDDVFFMALQKYLLCFIPANGDALVDFLLIELTLKFLDFTLPQWNSFYQALPFSFLNLKCKKADLQNFEAHAEHEKYLLKPRCLQKKIEEIVFQIDSKYGRCFVRPSGTEHLIRIYAEARTAEKAQEIINQVKLAVQEYISIP